MGGAMVVFHLASNPDCRHDDGLVWMWVRPANLVLQAVGEEAASFPQPTVEVAHNPCYCRSSKDAFLMAECTIVQDPRVMASIGHSDFVEEEYCVHMLKNHHSS